MALSEFAEKLHELPLLREMQAETRSRVAKLLLLTSNLTACADGETLINQRALGGQDGFILIDGAVTIIRESAGPLVVNAPSLLGEMLQFNPRAQRTATVTACGSATVLQFPWQEFYAQAKEHLSAEEQAELLESIERTVWERFGQETVVDVPMFRGLPDRIKLRVCVAMQWLVQRVALEDGARLVVQGELCGSTGYLLVNGKVRITERHQPPRILSAPNMIGVMPRFQADLQWSATCAAEGDAEFLKVPWQDFMATLERRLSADELQQFIRNVESNQSAGLAH